jgi:hypothetical protein
MKHPNEEELIAYHDSKLAGGPTDFGTEDGGDAAQREAISTHLKECPECKTELDRIDAVLAVLDSMPVPDPGEDYGQRVWKQIAPRLPEKRRRWWEFGLSKQSSSPVQSGSVWAASLHPRRLAAFGAVAALMIVAFIAGRVTTKHGTPDATIADSSKVRERILVMAVGEHLGRSEMVLVELSNAMPVGGTGTNAKQVNIAAEQRRAETLLDENRLYRQTALEQGDTAIAGVLDELERVLLDVAHSPQEVSAAQFETIRERIESKGILFKVRVVGQELHQRELSAQPSPGEGRATQNERKKI